jgi:hypothetical protein
MGHERRFHLIRAMLLMPPSATVHASAIAATFVGRRASHPHRRHEPERLTSRCRPIVVIACIFGSSKSWGVSSTHIHGTHVQQSSRRGSRGKFLDGKTAPNTGRIELMAASMTVLEKIRTEIRALEHELDRREDQEKRRL